jgi:hypothetical protein
MVFRIDQLVDKAAGTYRTRSEATYLKNMLSNVVDNMRTIDALMFSNKLILNTQNQFVFKVRNYKLKGGEKHITSHLIESFFSLSENICEQVKGLIHPLDEPNPITTIENLDFIYNQCAIIINTTYTSSKANRASIRILERLQHICSKLDAHELEKKCKELFETSKSQDDSDKESVGEITNDRIAVEIDSYRLQGRDPSNSPMSLPDLPDELVVAGSYLPTPPSDIWPSPPAFSSDQIVSTFYLVFSRRNSIKRSNGVVSCPG